VIINKMPIYLYNIYRSPNIGIFAKANEKFLFLPMGYSVSKSKKLAGLLQVQYFHISIGGARVLGPLMAMNSNGILVSRFVEEDELNRLKENTKLRVERFESKFTSVGNLIVANDKGCLVADILSPKEVEQIRDVLDVPTERGRVAGYFQVGSTVFATNVGALVHPNTSDKEIEYISDVLNVPVSAGSVNGGVPFVSSGLIGNSKGIITGTLTTGPELFIIGKVFKM